MKATIHTKIGVGLVLLGIVPFLFVEYLEHAHNWKPLDEPVTLKPGEIQLPSFTTDLDGRYLVSLSADQLQGRDLMDEQCMMGAGNAWKCGDTKQTVDFDWEIRSSGGAIIRSGSYEPTSISGAEIGFAEFEGHRREQEKVVLKIRSDAGRLNSRHPRVVVEAGPEAWEALPYLYILSRYWAGAMIIVGALVIVLSPRHRRAGAPGL